LLNLIQYHSWDSLPSFLHQCSSSPITKGAILNPSLGMLSELMPTISRTRIPSSYSQPFAPRKGRFEVEKALSNSSAGITRLMWALDNPDHPITPIIPGSDPLIDEV
jgi:hypothetical protein